jgi:hypothetical protein
VKKKKICIIVNFFIWIIIKNYWCDIKGEKSRNILTLIGIKKKKKKKQKYLALLCNVPVLDKKGQYNGLGLTLGAEGWFFGFLGFSLITCGMILAVISN